MPEAPTPSTPTDTAPTPASANAPETPSESSPPVNVETDKLVPVGEAIRYRKRAQTAEQQLGELHDRLADLQSRFDDSQQTITSLERRQKIDALLTDSDAIDLEAARLLTEISVSQMDEPDVIAAVSDLRRQKPYLFRHRPSLTHSAMSPHIDAPSTQQAAAERAVATGDRRDLLDYLRLRRKQPASF